jgi:hypothetical protein
MKIPRAVLLLPVLLPYLAAVLLRWGDGYDPRMGDYAQYLLHARALAEGVPTRIPDTSIRRGTRSVRPHIPRVFQPYWPRCYGSTGIRRRYRKR